MKEASISTSLDRFLSATWKSPVFGDTFSIGQETDQLVRAKQQLADIGLNTAKELTNALSKGMPETDTAVIQKIVTQEILPKTLAFCPALTIGELDDMPRLSAIATAVGLMYWGDQTMDRGDHSMAQAIELLDSPNASPKNPTVAARLTALRHIEKYIRQLALAEDAPYVTVCFYGQVLKHEAIMHRLSNAYVAAPEPAHFLIQHAREIAETATINAGFPSISSSLYAIYRHHDTALPPLEAVYHSSALTNWLQVCNVVVRLWDELGDWQMDTGHNPDKGLFVINPFNQYHPTLVQRFCELAFISSPDEITTIQQAVAHFHADRPTHTQTMLRLLSEHVRRYLSSLDRQITEQFKQYITLCKRVMEIGYVNRIGDIALATGDEHET